MTLVLTDWILIGAYLLLTTIIALRYTSQSGKDLASFFLGSRNIPWYVAGISMVATTFAADTPLAVTELVAKNGVSGNWLWWNFLIGGMLTTFFFARLWRRSGVMTEVELIAVRYSGKPARYLRMFKAVYLGLFMNVLILGWVNLALMSLLEVFFDIPADQSIWYAAGAMALVAIYSSLSGLLGVAITDMVQFFIAMAGSIVLAVLVLNSEEVGGIEGMKAALESHPGSLDFLPSLDSGTDIAGGLAIGIGAFLAYFGMFWWASWYPGAEPGGGGYIAQRMMSAKNEKHSFLATLFFQFAHYCLRPWPWILVGLCALVLYMPSETSGISSEWVAGLEEMSKNGLGTDDVPDEMPGLAQLMESDENVEKAVKFHFNPRLGYVFAMKDYLPDGLRGLLLVAFLAAFMSTVSTQLNWGASYLMNDFMIPLGIGNRKNDVAWSRGITVILMLIAVVVTMNIKSISGVWEFLIECGAGLGLVLILRWFWWRINAWSEIAATAAPFFAYGFLKYLLPYLLGPGAELEYLSKFPGSYFVTVGFTTAVWILVTYLTKPEDSDTLAEFCRRVNPGGWWSEIRSKYSLGEGPQNGAWLMASWLSAVICVYALLFGLGSFIFGDMGDAVSFLIPGFIMGFACWHFMKKAGLLNEQ